MAVSVFTLEIDASNIIVLKNCVAVLTMRSYGFIRDLRRVFQEDSLV